MNIDYQLYLVTDQQAVAVGTLEEAVRQAILGGCTMVQLREKDSSAKDFYQLAQRIKIITDSFHVPLIINDRIDIALAVNAAGVHVGQSDLPAAASRKLIGDKLLGVSVATVEEAIKAEKEGADYLGVGAMFTTETKQDARLVSIEELKKIRLASSLPIVVIGGINKATIPLFNHIPIDGLAVISAILSQPDIQQAAIELKQLFKVQL